LGRRERLGLAARAAALAAAAALSGCRDVPAPSVDAGRLVRARPGPERRLMALVPDHAPAGVVFQKQPDGRAGLAVVGMGFTRADVVRWDGRRLDTTFSSSRLLTVPVPLELLAAAGEHAVTVESSMDAAEPKLTTTFRILPPPPAPSADPAAVR
jgi:hypothetical protein